MLIFTFTFLGIEDVNIKLKPITLYIPRGNVYLLVDQAIYFTPKISTISSNVNCNLYTISSRSLYFTLFKSDKTSFLK